MENFFKNELIIVANRLPLARKNNSWVISPGGLVSALLPVANKYHATWIGWSGSSFEKEIKEPLPSKRLHRVELTTENVAGFYLGFANSVLWPLAHDRLDLVAEIPAAKLCAWWEEYVVVNQKFAEKVAEVASQNATVWVHDYHLQLLPRFLKQLRPDLKIGFFLHTPALPESVYRKIGTDLLLHEFLTKIRAGLAATDLFGVQTKQDASDIKNFYQLTAKVYPISIDPKIFQQKHDPVSITKLKNKLGLENSGDIENSGGLEKEPLQQMFLGVDRLDYAKGILERLQVFEEFLKTNISYKPVLVQVLTPTRESVPAYKNLHQNVVELSRKINAHYDYEPVINIFEPLTQQELLPFYRVANVMIVSSLRDGMNLVAKEFVAARTDATGVLLLSEHAGVSDELAQVGGAAGAASFGALVFDPQRRQNFLKQLIRAATMKQGESNERMRNMRSQVLTHTAVDWAKAFLRDLWQA